MSSGKFRSIINRLETTGLRMMVDPAENPFIERIRYYGNYWIFSGINYAPAYTLQGFLNVLCLRGIQFNDDFVRKAHQLLNFVLYISDTAARSLGYGMETIKHVEQAAMKFPDSQLSNRLTTCVCVPYLLIEKLIADEDVRQRLFIDFECRDLSQVISGEFQEFFAHPFLKADEHTAIILNPSILVPFAIHHLILLADLYGEKELLIDSYNSEIWRECKKDLKDLGHKKILESEYTAKESIVVKGLVFISANSGIVLRKAERMHTDFVATTSELSEYIRRQHFGVAAGYIDIQIR